MRQIAFLDPAPFASIYLHLPEFLIPVTHEQKLGPPGDLLEIKNAFVMLWDESANVNLASLLTRFSRSFAVLICAQERKSRLATFANPLSS